MPRDGSGIYTKPAGTTAVPNTTIESAKYNSTIDDIAQDLNAARPVVAGGTGGTSVTGAQAALSLDNKVVYASKSGNYTALATDNNAVHRYTATATVTLTAAATLGANWHYTVVADGGAVTIDPNASETIDGSATLIVPSGASRTIICDGSNFITVPSTNKWELIGDFTFSAVSSVDVTNLSPFKSIRICGNITPSASAALYLRTSSNNGSSFDNGASDYNYTVLGASGTASGVASGAFTAIPLSSTGSTGTGSGQGASFDYTINRFNKADYAQIHGNGYNVDGATLSMIITGGQRNQATARNAFRLLSASGTITGSFTVEGVRG